MPYSGFIVHEILSGRRQGFWPGLVRFLLLLMSFPYRVAAALRNFLYDRGWRAADRVDCPVISVGNLQIHQTSCD